MDGLVPNSEPHALQPGAMLRAVLRRQTQLFTRDKTLVKARLAQCAIMGLLMGSLFYDLSVSATDGRYAVADSSCA